MLYCSKCKTSQPVENFNKDSSRSNGYSNKCRICANNIVSRWKTQNIDKKKNIDKLYRSKNKEKNKEYFKRYRLENKIHLREQAAIHGKKCRDEIWALKNKPCADCSGTFHPVCMDFDHIDPTTKIRCVGNYVTSRKKVYQEIEKCELVCSNCHRIRTYNRKQYGKKSNSDSGG